MWARDDSESRCACHTASGTMILPSGTATLSAAWPSSRRSTLQSSSTTARCLMICLCALSIVIFPHQFAGRDRRGVHLVLEWRDAQALGGVDEAFVLEALAH